MRRTIARLLHRLACRINPVEIRVQYKLPRAEIIAAAGSAMQDWLRRRSE